MSGPLMAGYSIPFNIKNIMGSYQGAQQSAKRRDRALAIAGAMTESANPLDRLIAFRRESQIAPAFQEAQIEKLAGDNFRQNEYMEKILSSTRDISSKLEEKTGQRLRPQQGLVAEREQGLSDVGARITIKGESRSERELRIQAVKAEEQRIGRKLDQGELKQFYSSRAKTERTRMERMREQGAVFPGEEGFLSGPGSAINEPGEAPQLRGELARFGEGQSFEEMVRQGQASGSLLTELFEQQAPPELGTLEIGSARSRRKARLAQAGQQQMEQQQQRGLEEQVVASMYGGGEAYAFEGFQSNVEPTEEILMERGLEQAIEKYGNELQDARQAFIDFIRMNPISGDFKTFKRYIKQLLNPTRAVQGTTVQGGSGFEGSNIRRYE